MVRKKNTPAAKTATKRQAVAKPAAKFAKSKPGRSKSGKSKHDPSKLDRSKPDRSKPDPLDDLIAATTSALALTIAPAWTPSVRANLRVIFSQAELFTAFELPDDAEPAPIFRA